MFHLCRRAAAEGEKPGGAMICRMLHNRKIKMCIRDRWYMALGKVGLRETLVSCVLPFVPLDVCKVVFALVLAQMCIRDRVPAERK